MFDHFVGLALKGSKNWFSCNCCVAKHIRMQKGEKFVSKNRCRENMLNCFFLSYVYILSYSFFLCELWQLFFQKIKTFMEHITVILYTINLKRNSKILKIPFFFFHEMLIQIILLWLPFLFAHALHEQNVDLYWAKSW